MRWAGPPGAGKCIGDGIEQHRGGKAAGCQRIVPAIVSSSRWKRHKSVTTEYEPNVAAGSRSAAATGCDGSGSAKATAAVPSATAAVTVAEAATAAAATDAATATGTSSRTPEDTAGTGTAAAFGTNGAGETAACAATPTAAGSCYPSFTRRAAGDNTGACSQPEHESRECIDGAASPETRIAADRLAEAAGGRSAEVPLRVRAASATPRSSGCKNARVGTDATSPKSRVVSCSSGRPRVPVSRGSVSHRACKQHWRECQAHCVTIAEVDGRMIPATQVIELTPTRGWSRLPHGPPDSNGGPGGFALPSLVAQAHQETMRVPHGDCVNARTNLEAQFLGNGTA